MAAFVLELLLRRVALPLALLLLGSLLTGGCGFHFGNKWGSREGLIRPLPFLDDVRPQPKPKDDDDGRGGRRHPFRTDGPEPAAAPSPPAPAEDAAAAPALDGSAADRIDDTIRYSSTGERLLNNAQEW
jgi:hypothetical protein